MSELPEKPTDPSREQRDSVTRLALEALGEDADASWATILARTESRLRVLLELRGCRDTDDVLQEVWLQASRGLGEFDYRGPGSLQRWLAGIARNKMRERARSDRRGVELHASAAPNDSPEGLFAALRDTRPGVSTDVGRRDTERRVRQVLSTLPGDECEALLLRLYEGLSLREAGDRLGVDPSTVSLRVKRALGRCASRLEDEP
ncbi:MAG: RNA polymerase sigma factor [Planctomycetota bacterium]